MSWISPNLWFPGLSLSVSDFLMLEKPFSNLDLSLEHSDTLEVLEPYCPYFSQPVLVLGSAFSKTWFLHIEFLRSIQAKFHLGLAQSQLHPTFLHPLKPLTKASSCQMSCFSSWKWWILPTENKYTYECVFNCNFSKFTVSLNPIHRLPRNPWILN